MLSLVSKLSIGVFLEKLNLVKYSKLSLERACARVREGGAR